MGIYRLCIDIYMNLCRAYKHASIIFGTSSAYIIEDWIYVVMLTPSPITHWKVFCEWVGSVVMLINTFYVHWIVGLHKEVDLFYSRWVELFVGLRCFDFVTVCSDISTQHLAIGTCAPLTDSHKVSWIFFVHTPSHIRLSTIFSFLVIFHLTRSEHWIVTSWLWD